MQASTTWTATGFDASIASLRTDLLAAWEPKPRLHVWQIAEEHRIIPGDTAAPGQYRQSVTPWTQEVQERLHPDDPCQVVVCEWAAQTGKNTLAENWILAVAGGWYPSRMLAAVDTLGNAQDWARDNLDTMIESSPVLRGRIRDSVSRSKGETMLGKFFPGGRLRVVGMHSASAVCRMAAKYCWLDEVDRAASNPGYEGNVTQLVVARQSTFGASSKLLLTSTPTVEGSSEVHAWFLKGDQRYFNVPCPRCGERQPLEWEDPDNREVRYFIWDAGDPSSARYRCRFCGHEFQEDQKNVIVPAGLWVPTRPDLCKDGLIRSYNLNALYSPSGMVSWPQLVREWEAANEAYKSTGDPKDLTAYVNVRKAKVFAPPGESLDAHVLADHSYPDNPDAIPAGVKVLTTGTDVQKDRIEITTVGWGLGWECWVISHEVILTSPRDDDTWTRHDEIIRRVWTTEDGRRIRPAACCVDSGYLTQRVYEYARSRAKAKWPVYAVKGDDGKGAVWERVPHKGGKNKQLGTFYLVRTNPAKDELHDLLLSKAPGSRYVHIAKSILDRLSDYLDQLTAERRVKDKKTGRWIWEEIKTNKPHEAWDCLVYALAGAHALVLGGVNLRAVKVTTPEPIPGPSTSTPTPVFSEPNTTTPEPVDSQGQRTPIPPDPGPRGKPTRPRPSAPSGWITGGRGPRGGRWL